ncbi:hypothetical protein Golax_000653, partial [Gossypium laxum]|nr:hypothetical protein [Gossypium laxum]
MENTSLEVAFDKFTKGVSVYEPFFGPCFRVLERSLENLEGTLMKLAQFLGRLFFDAKETSVVVD